MKKFWLGFAAVITGGLTVYGAKQFLEGTVTEETRAGYIMAPFLFALCVWGLIRSISKSKRKAEEAKAVQAAPQAASPSAKLTANSPKAPQMRKAETAPCPAVSVPTPEPKPAVKKARHVYHGRIAGVTFNGRQGVLARLKKKVEVDYEQLYFELEQGEFEGEPTIKVMASLMEDDKPVKQIGFIAKDDIPKVLPYINDCHVFGEIYGGPEYEGEEDPKSYGCAIDIYVDGE